MHHDHDADEANEVILLRFLGNNVLDHNNHLPNQA
jgi:hypothetical protein